MFQNYVILKLIKQKLFFCKQTHININYVKQSSLYTDCLLYTSDAADDTPCVDLGGRRIIKKKRRKRI